MKLKAVAIPSCMLVALTLVCSAASQNPLDDIRSKALFFETFDDEEWDSRWKHSSQAKYTGRFTTAAAKDWDNKGLKIPEKNKHYGLTALLAGGAVDPVLGGPEKLPLVVQYEVKYAEGSTCGGAYLKLLSASEGMAAEDLTDASPYSIMFGPDRCGGPGKVHLIFRHRHPMNGTVSEKHLLSPPVPENNDYTHVYTLLLYPDYLYRMLIDGELKSQGSLKLSLEPPLVPPREVPDPSDKKPADWVDLPLIPDPAAVKPADWDERERIEDESSTKPQGWLDDEPATMPDPKASKPEDWDEEEDGAWEPNHISNPACKVGCGPWTRPLKRNPAYKGPWKPPLIDNPDYKGPWLQRNMSNPDWYEDADPIAHGVAPIGAVALELWTIDSGYMFDNVLITRSEQAAEEAREKLWRPRHEAEKKAFEAELKANEAKERERKKAERQRHRGSRSKSEEVMDALTEAIVAPFRPGGVLAPLQPTLAPALDWLEDNPQGAAAVVGLLPLVLVLFLGLRSSGRKKRAAVEVDEVGLAKKTDAAQPDDGEEEEAQEAAQEEAQEDVKAAAKAAKAAVTKAAAAVADTVKANGTGQGEITADDEEEEEEEEPAAGTRRRTRRAA